MPHPSDIRTAHHPGPCPAARAQLTGTAPRSPDRVFRPGGRVARAFAAAAGLAGVVMFGATASCAVAAEPPASVRATPDPADLGLYLECSEAAQRRALGFEEAAACSLAFLRIKLSFVPEVGLDRFQSLPPQEKAAINLVGYRRFKAWFDENPALIEAIRSARPPASTLAGN